MNHIKTLGLTFKLEKYSGLDGQTKCEWASENLSFIASPEGIVMNGNLVLTERKDLEDYAKLLADVWAQHLKLRPKIYKPGEQ